MAPKRESQASKRNLNQTTALNWNKGTEKGKDAAKGIKPVSDPMTIQQMAVVLLMHCCRKVLLGTGLNYKVGIYGVVILLGSVFCDFLPLPRFNIYQKNSALNSCFAKYSWAWTLLVVGTFITITSNIYCCGDKLKIRRHLCRLLVGTLCWYMWTGIFVWLEMTTGYCIAEFEYKDLGRDACLKKGYRWRGFDISGHTFLLLYCNLIIHEESVAIRGFERIRDLLREHEFDDDSPLNVLTPSQLENLKTSYEKFAHYVKASLVSITLLNVMWDFTLLGTILYFHTMAQKFAGAVIAIATWYVTYRLWYPLEQSPGLPGQGPFKYAEARPAAVLENRRRSIVGLRLPTKLTRNGLYHRESDIEKNPI